MERVTNVFCGGGSASISAPEKPSRLLPARTVTRPSNGNAQPPAQPRAKVQLQYHPQLITWDQLMVDERFLSRFFLYFSPTERRILAQVCSRWRDILYRSPRYWTGLVPVLQCRELRTNSPSERSRLYSSLLRRGFHAVCLLGATDEDALDLVHSFPLASKQVHSLSLRCSSVSDQGLEVLLDHLQVNFFYQHARTITFRGKLRRNNRCLSDVGHIYFSTDNRIQTIVDEILSWTLLLGFTIIAIVFLLL